MMLKRSLNNIFLFVPIILMMTLFLSCTKNDHNGITIGCISPFSGDGAVYGEALKKGFALYLDDLTESDPETFNRLNIIYEDDKLQPTEGVNALNKLIDVDRAEIVIGAFTSNVTLAIAPIAEKKGVVLLTPTATNYKIRDAGDYIFRVTPSDAYQGKVMAEFTYNILNKSTASILYMNTDYGLGLKSVFEKAFTFLGGEINIIENFEMGSRDMRTQLQKIKNTNSEVLFLPSNYVEAVNIVLQAKELNFSPIFVCTDGVFDQKFLDLTQNVSEGLYISTMAWGTGKYKDNADIFRSKFEMKYNEQPGVYSALCYDALAVVIQAAKTSEYKSSEIKKALYEIEYEGATGLNKFDVDGEVQKDFDIYQVKDNKFTRLSEL